MIIKRIGEQNKTPLPPKLMCNLNLTYMISKTFFMLVLE
jgi:hypothetical protein